MSVKVDLWEYLPPFLREYREMNALIEAENPEFQGLVNDGDSLLNNFFIDSAEEMGISRFEKIVGILPNSDDTIETRRTRLFARWNDVTPYTMTALKQKIAQIQGSTNIEIDISNYVMTLTTHMEQQGQVDDLAYLLKVMIPCNLKVISYNRIEGTTQAAIHPAYGFSGAGTLFLTNDLQGEVPASVPATLEAGASATDMLFLTNDISETVNIGGVMRPTNSMVQTDLKID